MTGNKAHGHAAERAYHFIRDAILRNELCDDTHLRETDLAERIGVSRTPVRDALRRLAAEGLVEIVPNVGSRVRRWDAQALEEIFGLRAVLEGYAARLAATRLTSEQIDRLAELCERMDACVAASGEDRSKRVALTPLNEQFHAIILGAAGNWRLETVVRQIISVPLVLRTFGRYEPDEIRRSMAHHRELVDAFRARDPDWAESVMRSHLHAGLAVMRRRYVADRTDGTP